ncbi:Pectate lyase superfamily protein [Polystyrenella longa]|uniref:Pectate lyase superfamily protein n=1 Tax=Polystyrenella longa TaxID=2528007 RepID=A0A518CLT5_9PLAN|nr:right-handed parallel beta-helix repeat-containing protein [Polystyrenella longa]QDU80177.1 Pectate lyase superfamily protein [Polystyrenella longa]
MSDVRNFGAMGDGKMDDTAAIQHAVDTGDGPVEIPAGNYLITKPIVVDLARVGRRSIHGHGGVAKIIMAGAGPAFFLKASHGKTADPKTFRPEEWQNERMPQIANLEIEGTHPEAEGIRIEEVMQPTLTGVLIRNVHHGVHVTSRARNVLIDGCHIYHNTGVGVFFDHCNLHQAIVSDSHISYNRLGGIRLEGGEIRNFHVTGNDIEYNNNKVFGLEDLPSAEIYIDIQDGSVREGTITSNTIQATPSPDGANIRIIGSKDQGNLKFGLWTISSNLITSQTTNIHISSSMGVTLSGNHLGNADVRSLLVEDSTQIVVGSNCFGYNEEYRNTQDSTGMKFVNCDNCNISGSIIHGKTESFPNVAERRGLVELVNCQRMSITGLQVFNGLPAGMYLEGCTDTLLTGCTVLDTRDGVKTPSIEWPDANNSNMLTSCRLDAATNLSPELNQQANVIL